MDDCSLAIPELASEVHARDGSLRQGQGHRDMFPKAKPKKTELHLVLLGGDGKTSATTYGWWTGDKARSSHFEQFVLCCNGSAN